MSKPQAHMSVKMMTQEEIVAHKARILSKFPKAKFSKAYDKFVEKPKADAPAPAKGKHAGSYTVEKWLHKFVKLHAIEEGYTDDDSADEWLQKQMDDGDYGEYEEEAIMAYGGHSDVAEMLYKNLLEKGYSKSSLIAAFKSMKEDGYTMFDELI